MKRIDWHILETLNDLCLWDAPVFPMIGHFYVSINPTMGVGGVGSEQKAEKYDEKKLIKVNQKYQTNSHIHVFTDS